MNKAIIIIIGILMLGCSHFESGNYPKHTTVRHYDSQGNMTGYTIETPYGDRHYDKDGRYIGKSERQK